MSESALAAGTLLDGKWRIEGLLGEGGMGVVYAARHVRNGREVALKLLHPAVASDKAARERFLLEGYAANQVDHPGAVQVLDDGVAPEGVFLVMERLRGAPIDAIAERRGDRLDLDATLSLLDAALEVLEVAHAKGMVHRDLKPENLFLTEQGTLKVLDFGLARVRQSESGVRLTATGVPMGTPAFMPPEQALAHWDEVDASSDVFALGASAYTLLSGQLIHPARTPPEMLVMASTRQAAPLRTVAPTTPPAVAEVVDRALAFDRRGRYPDARAMRAALRKALTASGTRLRPLSASGLLASSPADAVAGAISAEIPSDTARTVPAITPSLQAVPLGAGAPAGPPAWSTSHGDLSARGKATPGAAPPVQLAPTETMAPITSDRGRARTSSVVLVSVAAAALGVAGAWAIYRATSTPSTTPSAEVAAQVPLASAVTGETVPSTSTAGVPGPSVEAAPIAPSVSPAASAVATASASASTPPSSSPRTAPRPSPPKPSATATGRPPLDPDDPLQQYAHPKR